MDSSRDIIKFWESRRLQYNLVVGFAGILALFAASLISEKPINFFMLPFVVAFGLIFNICYTSGWLCTLLLRGIYQGDTGKQAITLLITGTLLSVVITFLLVLIQAF